MDIIRQAITYTSYTCESINVPRRGISVDIDEEQLQKKKKKTPEDLITKILHSEI